MSRPKLLFDDVKEICIQIVRGYDRRISARENGLMAPFDPSAIAAVEEAQLCIGFDLPVSERDKLIDEIMLSCRVDRHNFNHENQLTNISKSEFYNQRNHFLMNIARYLQLI